MGSTVLFLDTFTGPAGPLSEHISEVGTVLFQSGDLDGAGRLVQDGDGFLGVEVSGGAVELSDTYTATLKLVAPDIGASVRLYGYDPVEGTYWNAIAALIAPDGSVSYFSDRDGVEINSPPGTETVGTSDIVTLSLSVGPTGTTILAGDVLVPTIEFTTGDFNGLSLRMYAESYYAGVIDELSLTRITPDSAGPPSQPVSPGGSLPPGLDTSWEAAQDMAQGMAQGASGVGWSIFEGFAAGAEAPTSSTPVESQVGTSGATWSAIIESYGT